MIRGDAHPLPFLSLGKGGEWVREREKKKREETCGRLKFGGENGMKLFAKDGEFELTPEMVRGLQATYPAINVGRELQRIYWWSYKNVSRRWKDPVLGIEAWMRRATKATLEARQKNSRAQAEASKQAYLSGVKPREVVKDAWWATELGVQRKARELGMSARPGEGWPQFKARVQQAAKEREAA